MPTVKSEQVGVALTRPCEPCNGSGKTDRPEAERTRYPDWSASIPCTHCNGQSFVLVRMSLHDFKILLAATDDVEVVLA
jgi:DnaJ-class molecular chaperone